MHHDNGGHDGRGLPLTVLNLPAATLTALSESVPSTTDRQIKTSFDHGSRQLDSQKSASWLDRSVGSPDLRRFGG